jgi:broad specificity phosphatase PhoE
MIDSNTEFTGDKFVYYANPDIIADVYGSCIKLPILRRNVELLTKFDTYDDLSYVYQKIIKTALESGVEFPLPDKIQIFCSPFMRCMESAILIANILNKKEVYIDYGLSEYCAEMFFPLNDMPIDINKIYENSLYRIHCNYDENECSDDKKVVFVNNTPGDKFLNDTSQYAYTKRINDTLLNIMGTCEKEYIIIVTHSDAYRLYNAEKELMAYKKMYKVSLDPSATLLAGGGVDLIDYKEKYTNLKKKIKEIHRILVSNKRNKHIY